MDVSSATQNQIASVRQAIGMVNLRNAMNQNANVVSELIEGIEETTKEIERVAQPHLGNNIDVRVEDF